MKTIDGIVITGRWFRMVSNNALAQAIIPNEEIGFQGSLVQLSKKNYKLKGTIIQLSTALKFPDKFIELNAKEIDDSMEEIIPYSVGLCFASVCALKGVSIAKITSELNSQFPTGIRSKWKLSKNKKFNSGETNPCNCDRFPETRTHYLFNC